MSAADRQLVGSSDRKVTTLLPLAKGGVLLSRRKIGDANQNSFYLRRRRLFNRRLHFPGSRAKRAARSHAARSSDGIFARATNPSRLECGVGDWRSDR